MSQTDPIYILDMSNICWDREVQSRNASGPVLSRFYDVVDAIDRVEPEAEMHVVADNSLRHTLTDTSARQWRETHDAYGIIEAPVADDIILQIADKSPSAIVVSRDQFLDHRKIYPWIPGRANQFRKPICKAGVISLVPSGIEFVPHFEVSRKIEIKHLQHLGIDLDDHREILSRHWRCGNAGCLQSRLWDKLLLWPAVNDQGRALCPTCRAELVPVGPRPRASQVVVFDSQERTEITRLPVEYGTPVTVGRGNLRNGLNLDALLSNSEHVRRVSRQHVLLELDSNGQMRVTDLGSSNGTTIRRPGVPMKIRLEAHVSNIFGRRDSVELAKAVTFELSGQQFVPDSTPVEAPPVVADETVVD